MAQSDGRFADVPSPDVDIEATRTAIKSWLDLTLPTRTFQDKGNTVDIAFQHDFSSCGICVLNTIERKVNPNQPVFTTAERSTHRLRYFIAVMRRVHGQVGCCRAAVDSPR